MTETYAPTAQSNGHAPARPDDHFPPDVPFGSGPNGAIPFTWAAWILTGMRKEEIEGVTPAKRRQFSDWIKAASLEDL